MSETKHFLCRLSDIDAPGSKGFAVGADASVNLFVVRRQEQVFAYLNRCPHTGAPLEWKPDQFLDFQNHYIQCAIHGALFEMHSGYCVRGPCAGQFLKSEKLSIEGELIFWVESRASKTNSAPV